MILTNRLHSENAKINNIKCPELSIETLRQVKFRTIIVTIQLLFRCYNINWNWNFQSINPACWIKCLANETQQLSMKNKKISSNVLKQDELNCFPKYFNCWRNKTAGYHRHIFRPPIFLKMPFKRKKAFFFSKNTLSSSNFVIFPNFKQVFLIIFFQKKMTMKVEKKFSRNNIHWYIFDSKFSTFTDFEKKLKFFSKNPTSFQKNPNFAGIWEFLLFRLHSTGNFAIIWW